MDFELSEDQVLLRDSVERYVAEHAADAPLHRDPANSVGFPEAQWRDFAEMGWLALPFAEENDGLGGSATDVAVLMEAFGAGPVRAPYLPAILIAGRLVEAVGDSAQRADVVSGLIAGERRLTPAFSEQRTHYDIAKTAAEARRDGAGFTLTGRKTMALNADWADTLLVLARTGGASGAMEGLSLFLVPKESAGVSVHSARAIDGGRVADIVLDGVSLGAAALVGPEGGAGPAVEQALDRARAAAAAELAGAMRRVCEMTREYAGTRKQFGAALAQNQVIRHRLADMHIAAEEVKAMADMAAMKIAEETPDWRRAATAAFAKAARAGEFVTGQGIQLHGGVGMTDEYAVGRYYKRLMMLTLMFGDAEAQLRRMAA